MPETERSEPIETVLVVDDEILVRCEIAEYLRTCGFKVIEAVNAVEAQEVLLSEGTKVDVVLCSIASQENGNGFALVRWVREHRPGLSTILAGTPARAADAAADLCESGPFLARPYDPQLVHDRIRRMLAEQKRRKTDG
jgi:DNA-binding NtrC family response regulator